MDQQTMQLLVSTVQELSLARSIDRVIDIVRTVARKLTGADGAAFVLRDGDKCYYVDEDAIGPLWKGSRFPMESCISGWAMLNKKSAVIEDIYQDNRIPHDAYRPTFVKSLAMVPIRTMAPIGAIGNYWAQQHSPTPEQVTLLQSLADITAVTIENINVYNELEQRVKQRTAELEAANEELQVLNHELEAFSYSVSHDLRAPLRSIIGYSQVLEEESLELLNESGKKALQIILNNGRKMNNLIDDLLKFARLGRKPLEKTKVNVEQMVNEVIREMGQSGGSHKTKFEVSELSPVVGDYALLVQVWINLISNGVKYSSKKDQPVIEIGSYRDGNQIIYFVKDNGAGFDPQYADKLFGVFQRLHTVKEFEGTGIGLALVKRIVTRHGGRVWANGEVDKGATFYFSMPVQE